LTVVELNNGHIRGLSELVGLLGDKRHFEHANSSYVLPEKV